MFDDDEQLDTVGLFDYDIEAIARSITIAFVEQIEPQLPDGWSILPRGDKP